MNDEPPFLDVAGRPSPTPGPLTKPVVTQRPRRRKRARWIVPVLIVVVLAAAGGIVVWSGIL